jgi:hypothetical protein
MQIFRRTLTRPKLLFAIVGAAAATLRNLSRLAASTQEPARSPHGSVAMRQSQYVVNYKAEQAIYRGFLRTI